MKRLLWLLLLVLMWPKVAASQLAGNATLVLFPQNPTGNCNARQLALNQLTGSLYTCVAPAGTALGVWQVVAGGGPGGGWNPPNNAPGNTVFGNNTVGTGTPSFFTPGGDVSFSGGLFSVNALHFGPNILALTNTGIATGNCLQVSGSNLIGGACGTGGGGSVISFSAGNLSPLFTTSVTSPSITPVLTFNLSSAPANTMLGNNGAVATTPSWIPIPAGGGGGGLGGGGTQNFLAKWTSATTIGNSLVSDNGTALSYTGTGGISASQFTSIGTGGFLVTSALAALPATPGAGQNGLVSGPNGWYFSNNNSAWALMGTGGAGGGVSSFNTRTGPVVPVATDYTPAFIGAAPVNNANLTGIPTAPTAAQTVDNTQIATTAFVHAAVVAGGGGGGGGQPIPIAHSTVQAPTCTVQNSNTGTLTIPSLNIQQGDTVLVGITIASVSSSSGATSQVVANPSNQTYTSLDHKVYGSGTSWGSSFLFASPAGGADAATSLVITNTGLNASSLLPKFVACVAAYTGVNSITLPAIVNGVNTSGTALSNAVTTQDDNGYMFAVFSQGVLASFSTSPGTILDQQSTTTGGGATAAICENTAANPSQVACNITSTVSASWGSVAVELRPGATGGPVIPTVIYPKVVAYGRKNLAITTTASTNSPFFTCSITNCPANGYYRIAWDFLGVAGCSGNPNVNINVDYVDESASSNRHTGMIDSPGAAVSGTNHVFGYRHMTVAAPTLADPGQSVAAGLGINATTSQGACSSGTGTAQVVVTIERLQ